MAAVSQRFLNLVITGENLSGPAVASLGGDLTNVARVSNNAFGQMSRSTGFLSQQLYILRRSFEYAIAGMGLYKVYQAISAWKSYRQELGQLNTTLDLTQSQLTSLGQEAIQVSNATGQSLTNTLQSFQNISQQYPSLRLTSAGRGSIGKFAQTEDILANVIGAEPQDVGSAIGAIATAMYGRNTILNPKKGPMLVNQLAAMILQTQKRAGLPNASGEDILTAMQNLIGGAGVGRFTFPQALSMFDVIEKQIASPSKASLYLRQLMARLIVPTTSEAAYYAQAGLPSGVALQGMSGQQILTQLVKAVISQPGSNMTFAQAQKAGFNNVKLGPEGLNLLEKAIGGRLQSSIAASLIVKGFGQIASLEKNLYGTIQPGSSNPNAASKAQQLINQANQEYLAQNQLQLAGVRLSNLSTQTIDNMNPLIQHLAHYSADVLSYTISAEKYLSVGSRAIDTWISKIPYIGKPLASLGAGGILEAFGLYKGGKFLGGKLGDAVTAARSSDWLKMIPLLRNLAIKVAPQEIEGLAEETIGQKLFSKIASGPLDLQELKSALFGQANGTPEAPFWVVISPLSMQTIPFLGTKGTSGETWEQIAAKLGQKAAKPGAAAASAAKGAAGAGAGDIEAEEAAGGIAGVGTVGALVKLARRIGVKNAAKLAAQGSVADVVEGYGLKGIAQTLLEKTMGGDLPLAVATLFFGSAGGMNSLALKLKKGSTAIQSGDFARSAPTMSLASLIYNSPNLLGSIFSGKTKLTPGIKELLTLRSQPKIQQDFAAYAQKKISLTTLDNLLEAAAKSQMTSYFMSKPGIPTGVILPDSVDGTFILEPTAALAGLLKPQKIRGKVPLRYVSPGAPAPSTRATKPTARTQ